MKVNLKKILLPLLLLVAAIGVAIALSSARKTPEKKDESRLAPLVQLLSVSPQDLAYQIESQGAVQPKSETSLVSEVNGKIVKLADVFVAGGFFQQGDLLVQLEQADYRTNVKAAEAGLANAQALLAEEKARAKVAERDWQNFTSGRAPDLGLRKPQLASALAKVNSAEADLERAQRDLSRTEIRAPYSGIVKNRNASLGQFISRGNSLGVIVATDIAEIRLPLSDADFAQLQLDPTAPAPVMLSADQAGQITQWPAQLVRTEGILDERSRVIYVVAEVKDPYQRQNPSQNTLRFGQFVHATIAGRNASQVLQIPRHLLRPGNQILVADQELKLQFRTVVLDHSDARFAYLKSGLNSGDQLVTSALANPLAGTKVRSADAEVAVKTTAKPAAESTP